MTRPEEWGGVWASCHYGYHRDCPCHWLPAHRDDPGFCRCDCHLRAPSPWRSTFLVNVAGATVAVAMIGFEVWLLASAQPSVRWVVWGCLGLCVVSLGVQLRYLLRSWSRLRASPRR